MLKPLLQECRVWTKDIFILHNPLNLASLTPWPSYGNQRFLYVIGQDGSVRVQAPNGMNGAWSDSTTAGVSDGSRTHTYTERFLSTSLISPEHHHHDWGEWYQNMCVFIHAISSVTVVLADGFLSSCISLLACNLRTLHDTFVWFEGFDLKLSCTIHILYEKSNLTKHKQNIDGHNRRAWVHAALLWQINIWHQVSRELVDSFE